MEKYGFVYIWYDCKHKRYYIGCHWGTESDGYICSSVWMRDSYKRRPLDFKRKIIKRTSIREELFSLEDHYLNMIKENEFGKKYYNLQRHWRHWSEKEQTRLSMSEKISIATKKAMCRPDVRQRYLEGCLTRNSRSSDPDVCEKRRVSMKKTMAKKFPIENRYNPPKFGSQEYRDNMAKSISESWKTRDKETISEKISESLKQSKEIRSQLISSLRWYNNGLINKRLSIDPGPEWNKGRLKNRK